MTAPDEIVLPSLDKDPELKTRLDRIASALEEVMNCGTHVLSESRLERTQADWQAPSYLMFQAALETIGAMSAQIRQGWAEPAMFGLRVIVESTWYLEHLLKEDQRRRGVAYLVWVTHHEARQFRRLAASSREGQAFRQQLATDPSFGPVLLNRFVSAVPPDIDIRLAQREQRLHAPGYDEANVEYERIITLRPRPNWFSMFNDTVRTIEQLARQLGHGLQYELSYRHLAVQTHVEHVTANRLRTTQDGLAMVRQLRSPDQAQLVAGLAAMAGIEAILVYASHYTPFLKEQIVRWHKEYQRVLDWLGGPPMIRLDPT